MAQEVSLPAALNGKYRLTTPLYGGPVFAFPAYGFDRIDFSTLTEQQAERLLRNGWKGIEKVTPAAPRSAEKPLAPEAAAKP